MEQINLFSIGSLTVAKEKKKTSVPHYFWPGLK